MKTTLRNMGLLSLLVCLGCDNTTMETPDPVLQTSTADSSPDEMDVDVAEQDEVTREEVRTQAEQAIETASEFAAQEQQEYRQQVQARLDQIQQHIDALKEEL